MSWLGFLSSKKGSETIESESSNDNTEETMGANESSEEDADPVDESSTKEPAHSSQPQTDPDPDVCTEQCTQHVKDVIQYFCPLHDDLGCGVCVMIDHRNCEGVVYIPKVADDVPDSEEFKEFEKDLAELHDKSEAIMATSRENIPKAVNSYKEAVQKMDNFRKEKIARLNQMEADLRTRATASKEENTRKMNQLIDKTAATQSQVDKMAADMDTMIKDKQLCKLYIEMKTAKREMSGLRETLEKLEEENSVTLYRLVPGKRKLDLLEDIGEEEEPGTSSEGEVVQERKRPKLVQEQEAACPGEVKAEHMTDVCIKCDTDQSIVCKAEGLAVLPGNRLVVADRNNCKVKLVDTLQNKVIAELTVPSVPLGVTAINEKRVAVALKGELAIKCDKLLLLKVDRTLKAERLIKTKILFGGDIAYINDKFLVIKDNGCQVFAVDMVGRAEKINSEGQSFGCFVAVSVAPDNSSVYIASVEHQENCEEGYVLRKTRHDGELKCLQAMQNVVYTDLFQMEHAADQTGRVFVLGPNTVQLMDEAGSEPRGLLSDKNGVYSPVSLAYEEAGRKLYVGMRDNNYLKVFKLG